MAGDPLQPVTEGQKFNGLPMRLYNPLTRLVRNLESDTLLSTHPAGKPPQGLIYVQNNSGSAVQRFGVLGLSGALISDSVNLDEFQNKWALTGVTPTAAYTGKFCIAWEPIAAGAIGRAFIIGSTPCQVKMNSTTDPCADVLPGDATQLQSGGTGAAQIVFCGQPISSGSSTYWCIVLLKAGAVIPCVRPTATLTGRGWYSGFVCPGGVNASAGLNPATDLSPANFSATYVGGSIPTGTVACYVMNIREAYSGASGSHSMEIDADGSGTLYPRSFPAIYIGQSTDSSNVPTYLIDGVQDAIFCPTT